MRIFLLPISTRRVLLYCEKASHPTATNTSTISALPDRIVTKANSTWADWERAPKGWKATLTRYGNAAFRRIPFEEWGLKSLPPLHDSTRRAALAPATPPARIVHPPGLAAGYAGGKLVLGGLLRRLATERAALHRSRLIGSLLACPLTIPFGLIPILPNVPFFYAVFRAWSHYKALYGGRYLELLLDEGKWLGHEDERLGKVYGDREGVEAVGKADGTGEDGVVGEERLLLDKRKAREVAGLYDMPELEIELDRAVEQVEIALAKAQSEQAGKTR